MGNLTENTIASSDVFLLRYFLRNMADDRHDTCGVVKCFYIFQSRRPKRLQYLDFELLEIDKLILTDDSIDTRSDPRLEPRITCGSFKRRRAIIAAQSGSFRRVAQIAEETSSTRRQADNNPNAWI